MVLKPDVFSQKSVFPSKLTSLQNVLYRQMEETKEKLERLYIPASVQRCVLQVCPFQNQVTPHDDKTQLPF